MLTILEAIPLSAFLLYIRNIDTEIPQNWEAPFIISGLMVLIVIIFFLYRKILFNRILLGINIYLLCGGMAFITHQWWLNRLYDTLQASGMLLLIIITGILSIFLSSKGFIGANSPDKKNVKRFSVYLLLCSVFAFAISFGFRGSRILSELVPFIGLFFFQSLLKRRLAKKVMNLFHNQPVRGMEKDRRL